MVTKKCRIYAACGVSQTPMVYTFCEVMDHIDLSGYFVMKGYKTGRPGCDKQKLLKVILFAFMGNTRFFPSYNL